MDDNSEALIEVALGILEAIDRGDEVSHCAVQRAISCLNQSIGYGINYRDTESAE